MLAFGVLGPVQVSRDGDPIRLASTQRQLLAALLCRPGRPLAATELVEELWGDRTLGNGRRAIHVYVHRLRRALGDGTRVRHERGGYLLAVADDELDLTRFQRLTDDARRAYRSRQLQPAGDLFGQALSLWRGVPFADIARGDLVDVERRRLEEQLLVVQEERCAVELDLGRSGPLVGELSTLAGDHPYRERLRALLMLALYRAGRQVEALAAFRAYRSLLRDQLGVDPGEVLQWLHEAMLRGDDRLGTVAAGDLERLATPGRTGASTAPPATDSRVAGPPPRQLPSDVPGFAGRGEPLGTLDELFDIGGDGTATVLVVAGSAGVGKTALAVHWAHRMAERFPDGQLYVDLRGHVPDTAVPPAGALAQFLRSLGVAPDRVPADVDEAAALYRSLQADRRMLVLLDNAASADQVRPLLPAGPGCLVLVTSRQRLDGLTAREGARRLTLGVMAPAEAVSLLADRLGAARVAAEPAATRRLAWLCAYLPLALCIAAAHLAANPNSTIEAYVADLAGGDRLAGLAVIDDEQASIRTAFNLSYRAIPAPAQRLFRLLGLVPGPDVTADAAAAVAGTSRTEAVRLLDRLAAAHLIEAGRPGRYAFHDLLRLYARELSQRDGSQTERFAATSRLLDWYLHTARAAADRLYPQMVRLPLPGPRKWAHPVVFGSDEAAWQWLDAERVNLVAATSHAAISENHRHYAWQLADQLRGYFWVRLYGVDWLATARSGLAAAGTAAEPRGQAAMLISLGLAYLRLGRYQEARRELTRAVALARRSGWQVGLASALSSLGLAARHAGQLLDAIDHLRQALAVNRRTGRRAGQSVNLANLGVVYYELGQLVRAAEHYQAALAIDRELAQPTLAAFKLGYLGEVCHALGRTREALDHLTAALPLVRQAGERDYEAEILRELGEVYLTTGRPVEGLAAARHALALIEDSGDPQNVATGLNRVGACHRRLGQHRAAVDHHTRAIELAHRTGAHYAQTEALVGRAAARCGLGELADARDDAGHAVALAQGCGFRALEGRALTTLAEVDLGDDRLHDAVRHARRAVAIQRGTGHLPGQAQALLVLAEGRRRSGARAAAGRLHRAAGQLLAEIGAATPARSLPTPGRRG